MRLRVAGIALVLVAGALAGCGHRAGTLVSAEVESLDRTCTYHQTETTTYGTGAKSVKSRDITKDCSTDPEFLRLRAAGTRSKTLVGHATAIMRYTSAQDHQSHQAWLKVDATDDAFYKLDQGQTLQVWIDPQDPNKASL